MTTTSYPGSIVHHLGGAGWSWGRCGCHKDPCQTEFQFCQVLRMGSIKLQLLYGVRIELAVGSLPYPGNYLDFQFVSPWWYRPLSGLPICKPCLDVRQSPSRCTHFPSYGRHPLPKTKKPNQPTLTDYPKNNEVENLNLNYLYKTRIAMIFKAIQILPRKLF